VAASTKVRASRAKYKLTVAQESRGVIVIEDKGLLVLLGLVGLGALAVANNQSTTDGSGNLTPSAPGVSEGLSGLGADTHMVTPTRWFDLSSQVKIYIPFPTRSVKISANSYQNQFQYGGRWYTGANLLRVWNPIRQLPSSLR